MPCFLSGNGAVIWQVSGEGGGGFRDSHAQKVGDTGGRCVDASSRSSFVCLQLQWEALAML